MRNIILSIILVVTVLISFQLANEINDTATNVKSGEWLTYENTNDDLSRWPIYQDDLISFRYPPQWQHAETRVQSMGSVVEFILMYPPPGWKKIKGTMFYFTVTGNYSQVTGRPYNSLEEYLAVRSVVADSLTIDGYPAGRFRYASDVKPLKDRQEEVVVFVEKEIFISFLFRGTANVNSEYFNDAIDTWFEPLLSSVDIKL